MTSPVPTDPAPTDPRRSGPARVVAASTLGFTMLFALWTMFNIVGLPLRAEFGLTDAQFALLTALPILTGSLLRLPGGLLADRFGGKRVFVALTLLSAAAAFAVPALRGPEALLAAAAFVGVAGVSFAVGNAWIAQWVAPERQGLALGTFGAGNVGASVTKLLAPALVAAVPVGLLVPGGWRFVPFLYGVLLLVTALGIALLAPADRPARTERSLADWLRPLRLAQVWRFGLYYVVFFGAYVALAAFLPKFYVERYGLSLPEAGALTALFIFPASLLRPLGGYLSDRYGPRVITVASFAVIAAAFAALAFLPLGAGAFMVGTLAVGVGMGVGKAANYKLVAHWYPRDMGVVGGLVGLLGGLGGFFLPLAFAALGGPKAGALPPFAFLLALTLVSGAVFTASMARIRSRERLAAGRAPA